MGRRADEQATKDCADHPKNAVYAQNFTAARTSCKVRMWWP